MESVPDIDGTGRICRKRLHRRSFWSVAAFRLPACVKWIVPIHEDIKRQGYTQIKTADAVGNKLGYRLLTRRARL